MKNLFKKDEHGRDIIYWIIAILVYAVGCAVSFGVTLVLVECFNLYWGFLLLSPLMGFIVFAPILIYQEIYVERKYKKEKEQREKRREKRLKEIKAQAEKGFY